MNYLAHAYLSFGKTDILAGNMISDFVKGKKQFDYPVEIQKGIRLHRAIDTFTDEHETTAFIKNIFRKKYGLYAGPIVDVVYDYFLANDKNEFPTAGHLMQFSQETYSLLHTRKQWLGERFGYMFPYMESQNWLYYYHTHQGIKNSLHGLQRRAKYMLETETAFKLFLQNESIIQEIYRPYFISVKKMAIGFLANPNT